MASLTAANTVLQVRLHFHYLSILSADTLNTPLDANCSSGRPTSYPQVVLNGLLPLPTCARSQTSSSVGAVVQGPTYCAVLTRRISHIAQTPFVAVGLPERSIQIRRFDHDPPRSSDAAARNDPPIGLRPQQLVMAIDGDSPWNVPWLRHPSLPHSALGSSGCSTDSWLTSGRAWRRLNTERQPRAPPGDSSHSCFRCCAPANILNSAMNRSNACP